MWVAALELGVNLSLPNDCQRGPSAFSAIAGATAFHEGAHDPAPDHRFGTPLLHRTVPSAILTVVNACIDVVRRQLIIKT
jgi:hypothetical protein